ncbi:hypothetical protein T552_00203 [Pneumocystis carinii B80]|uniref:DNA replication regulator SLD2 n=1 Tax=Pneumocystis carinii (strain B80) TaxID=1408658 RepID=A0A0W4ZT64_PNEC8|nr:hypothetical protein T552_00203 [Pneumocystis carinii B80]KTW31565.1 hypothetical protein T552_00203 [Pneumocystis carinii B80]
MERQKEGLNEGNRDILSEKNESGGSIMGYREKLRRKLKNWERKFEEQEGRKPEKKDIKKDKKIEECYKLYSRIRTGKIEPDIEKIKKKECLIKTHDISEKTDEKMDVEIAVNRENMGFFFGGDCEEIGPTPQKIGRPIGIFEGIYDSPYVLERRNGREEEELMLGNVKTPVKKDRDIERMETPIKTQNRNNYLTTPAFLKRSVELPLSISPKFSFRTTLLSKKSLSSLIEELRQIEDNFVDPGEEVLREIESQSNNALIEEEMELKEPIEKVVSENKTWKKKGIKRSKRRVILRPIIKKEVKKLEDQSKKLIEKKAFKENHILHENNTLNNVDKGNTKGVSKHKKYIKGKGGVFLQSQVSRNYVSYKLKKYKSKFRRR